MKQSKPWTRPLRLVHNKFYRSYKGGREIDRFRSLPDGEDSLYPEAWVGSTTRTRLLPKGLEDPHYGVAEVYVDDQGHRQYLDDLIRENPKGFLGDNHVSSFGNDTGLLVKLLDSAEQLLLQTHPTREYASQYFNSQYGKVESWYILATRTDGEEPYVLLGFKEGISRAKFQELYLKQDEKAMDACCHKVPVKAGDMFFVDAGLPHAVGPGCFMVEVQEPSDVGVNSHIWWDHNDRVKHEFMVEKVMGCFDYTGRSLDETLQRYKIDPEILDRTANGTHQRLLGSRQTPYFSIDRLDVQGIYQDPDPGLFSIVVIIGGQGTITTDQGELAVRQGDELLLPAGMGPAVWQANGGTLSLIKSFPERV